jgi:hypothetical protein
LASSISFDLTLAVVTPLFSPCFNLSKKSAIGCHRFGS